MKENILEQYGYTKSQIDKILNTYSIRDLNEENLYNHIKNVLFLLETLKYNKKQIIKIMIIHTVRLPQNLSNLSSCIY